MTEEAFNPTPDEIASACQTTLPELALKGIALFNDRRFFEAHEELELAWRAEPGVVRELYRGILQVAVAYYHITRGNYRGAEKMFTRAARWLAPFPGACCGLDLDGFRCDYRQVEEALRRLGPRGIGDIDRGLFKPLRFLDN